MQTDESEAAPVDLLNNGLNYVELRERSERFLKSAFLTFAFMATSEGPQIKWLAFDGRNVIPKKQKRKIGDCTNFIYPEKRAVLSWSPAALENNSKPN